MESAFYGYYYISTDCIASKWNTKDIENFINNYNGFSKTGAGCFRHNESFCVIHLMNIKNYESWDSNDYNKIETNYIDIVTRKKLSQDIINFFQSIENFLGFEIKEEKDV